MKKYLILIKILFFNIIYTQIKYNISIKEKINTNQFIIKIELNNLSNNSYVIPVDTTGFKAFYPDEMCWIGSTESIYKYLSPTILFQNSINNKNIEAYSRSYDLSEESIPRVEKYLDSIAQKRKILIQDWANKENIKDIKIAEKNFYLTKNLVILKSKQSFSYNILLDISNIKRSDLLSFDSYLISPNFEYNFSSIICIDDKIYNYLTKRQKDKYKKYKFFTGQIVSNKIESNYKH